MKLALHAFKVNNIANSIHVVRDGAEAVGGVEVAVAGEVFGAAPAACRRRLQP